jgi:pyruvate dehydrogenase E2 component (dihydrolipoamide acetyltransferase)
VAQTIDVRVPDIGDFKDVPVIEILVKPGDSIKKNDSLVTLESDKASMEVPSPVDGVVSELKVNIGDKVGEGSLILSVASDGAAPAQAAAPAPQAVEPSEQNVEQAAEIPQPALENGPANELVEVTVPDIGDFKDIPVIEVLVKPGDEIKKDASLVTLESDKATMEVPASVGGTVREVKIKIGDKVSQGAVIALVETNAAPKPAAPKPAAAAPAPSAPAARPTGAASASVAPSPAAPASAVSGNGAVHASPSIRRFARELGVDLHGVSGSGPNGRVTRDDVQSFVKRALQNGGTAAAPATSGLGVLPWPSIDFAQYGEVERKPLSRIKKISGANLHRNWVMIPHVTQNDDADVTDLEAFRKQLNAELGKSGTKVTMLAFLIKASIAALKKFPEFNSSLDGEELVYKRYYNIGFAADTPNGLMVPVIKNADGKGITELAKESAELAAKAREGKLGPSDMQGGTFTISSLGSIGGTYFTPIINAPEVAILGACRAAIRPVWDGSAFVPRLMQPLSLSYDHRIIDGAAAARFTTYLIEVLSDLRRALL